MVVHHANTTSLTVCMGMPIASLLGRTAYDELSDTSLVRCRPITGRTHQLRVHAAWLGYPIANDALYGGASEPSLVPASLGSRPAQHAQLEDTQRRGQGDAGTGDVGRDWHNVCYHCVEGGDEAVLSDEQRRIGGIWLHAFRYDCTVRSPGAPSGGDNPCSAPNFRPEEGEAVLAERLGFHERPQGTRAPQAGQGTGSFTHEQHRPRGTGTGAKERRSCPDVYQDPQQLPHRHQQPRPGDTIAVECIRVVSMPVWATSPLIIPGEQEAADDK